MCWYGSNIKRIAEEDIKVFKVVNKKDTSQYYDFLYKFGQLYKSDINIDWEGLNNTVISINKGIHSYDLNVKIEYFGYAIRAIKSKSGNEILNMHENYIYKLVNCTIPKGSIYYLNDEGEYVSNQLIYGI